MNTHANESGPAAFWRGFQRGLAKTFRYGGPVLGLFAFWAAYHQQRLVWFAVAILGAVYAYLGERMEEEIAVSHTPLPEWEPGPSDVPLTEEQEQALWEAIDRRAQALPEEEIG